MSTQNGGNGSTGWVVEQFFKGGDVKPIGVIVPTRNEARTLRDTLAKAKPSTKFRVSKFARVA